MALTSLSGVFLVVVLAIYRSKGPKVESFRHWRWGAASSDELDQEPRATDTLECCAAHC